MRSVPSSAAGRNLVRGMLKGFDPGQELLFGEHHTGSDFVVRNLPARCEFVKQSLTHVEKRSGFGELEESPRLGTRIFCKSLRWWFAVGSPPVCFEEVSLDCLQRRDEVSKDDGNHV